MRILIEHHTGDDCDCATAAVAGAVHVLNIDMASLHKAVVGAPDQKEPMAPVMELLFNEVTAHYRQHIVAPIAAHIRGAHVLEPGTTAGNRR
jgi:hypothetical protein